MKKMYRPLAIIMLAAIAFTGCEEKKPDAPFQACAEFDDADARMLKIIKQIQENHKGDRIFLNRFEMEQVYWSQYKERRLKAMYPQDWNRFYRKNYGNEMFNSCKCLEYTRLTEDRIADLNMYLEKGPKDQEDCPNEFKKLP